MPQSNNEVINRPGFDILVYRRKVQRIRLELNVQNACIQLVTPTHVSYKELCAIVDKYTDWIIGRLPLLEQLKSKQLSSDNFIVLFGKNYSLKFVDNVAKNYIVVDEILCDIIVSSELKFATNNLRKLLLDLYKKLLFAIIDNYLYYYQKKMLIDVSDWRISRMKTRWGSCNYTQKRLNFNLALVRLDSNFIEYVVVHELAHLFEANHGPKFKAILSRYLPNWQVSHKYLKQQLPIL